MRNQIIMLLVGIAVLSGCAQILPPKPDDPYYAPAIPLVNNNIVQQPQTGSLFSATNASFLYSDRTASRVGDLLTINLNESTNASKNADTEIKKKDANSMAPTISARIPSYGEIGRAHV